MDTINLEKQYSHFQNLRITGELTMDIPVLENGQVTNKFKTIHIKGQNLKLTIKDHTIHFHHKKS